ncbi:transferase hexapeptide repeat family protein [Exilibacterium tricleocarpae]|uniref:Transferase hexapeptide repeat family protein n=1 Tax=Exilibacterium tricleocarpae TaxID=2591008 RepID=A0A545SP16_9GAMM|nr:transferase hexapeptide repeat family protein [Exilibacterium tricleocarpae]TQV66730.1 transferase hexapeptide repeat family protein [Exilibacterium tricleocarpae]
MSVYSIDNLTPVVDPSAYVHPSAVLIGDVIIGAEVYIGPLASLRGDMGRIVIGQGANVQDTCVVHTFPGKDCTVHACGHIGHGAVLHGCDIGANSLVGMNTVIMDDARIGDECIVGACSFVKARFAAPARSLIAGSPAVIRRQVSDAEIAWKTKGTEQYRQLAQRCRAGLRETEPLVAVEPGRRRLHAGDYQTLADTLKNGENNNHELK